MKKIKIVLLMFLVLSMNSCGNGENIVNASSGEPNPKLHIVVENGDKFLADDNGTLLYSLGHPYVYVDVDRKVFVISSSGFYAPGTTYYGSRFDGYTASCSNQFSDAGFKTLEFGPAAGEFAIPSSCSVCWFQAFVVDGEGTLFKTDTYSIFFTRSD